MSLTIKKLLIFTLSFIILFILILYDPRGSILAEPFNLNKAALSIAISHLLYGVEGFVGLHEVYEHLGKIPHASNYFSKYYSHLGGFIFAFDNIEQIHEYNKIISQTITEAGNLSIADKENVHTYQNDIGYIFYIIISFLIFGINLKSISIFFLSILFFSSVVFMFNFQKNNLYFFLLQTFLFALIIVIIGNYGGSVQIASINNQRFLSVLAVIPALHLSLTFFTKNKLSTKFLLSTITQFLILIFLCHVRGTSMWAILFLILFYLFWILINISKKNKQNIFAILSSIILFFLIFNLSGEIVKRNLAPEYKNKSVITASAYQEQAKETAIFPPNKALEYLSLGLVGEAGEIANKVKKTIRDNKPTDALAGEIGDVLWYCAMLADHLNSNLGKIMENNLEKLRSRKERGALGGSGDSR